MEALTPSSTLDAKSTDKKPVCWTSSRQVHVFDKGGEALSPPVFLDCNTKIQADLEQTVKLTKEGGFTLVAIRVLSGRFAGREGYVPRTCVKEYVLAGTPTPDKKAMLTGVSYGGGNKISWDGKTRVLETLCPACGQRNRLHRIPETDGPESSSRQRCSSLVNSVAKLLEPSMQTYANDVGLKGQRAPRPQLMSQLHGVMVGVLIATDGTVFAAHSGPKDLDDFGGAAQKLGMTWAKCVVDHRELICASSSESGNASVQMLREQLTQYRLTCAAPKLIQAVLRQGLKPAAMTEIMLKPPHKQPNKIHTSNKAAVEGLLVDYAALHEQAVSQGKSTMDHGHTIESCDQCRHLLPFMLCGLNTGKSL